MTKDDLFSMQAFLKNNCGNYDENLPEAFVKRRSGHFFTLDEHIKGMIYALLSNQREWHQIDSHKYEIDKLFFNYDSERIKETNVGYFIDGIKKLKCGNISIGSQMVFLKCNIEKMEILELKYGSMDAYVLSKPIDKVVKELSSCDSDYKLNMMGEALTYEYLRNVGIDACKPDMHLRRFLGSARMGSCEHEVATVKEAIAQMEALAKETGMSLYEIDKIIWEFCAKCYGKICTATPDCDRCVVKMKCQRDRVKLRDKAGQ